MRRCSLLVPLSLALPAGCFDPSTTPIDEPTTTGVDSGDVGSSDAGSTTDPADSTGADDSGSATGSDPACGNGVVDEGEDCDDMGESATCDADCTVAECGDMTVNPTAMEACDDGNDDETDACIACVAATCGDGIVWAGTEECDDGDPQDANDCTNECTLAVCGDGVVWNDGNGVEDCDDMGESATCDDDCTVAECGDMVVNAAANEQCDDGNADDTDACVQCVPAACGDGFVQAAVEECDDGNLVSGDGCDDQCIDENPLLPNVLQCGPSGRDVSTFFPPMSGLNLIIGCVPDANTQAIIVTRNGAASYNPADLVAYINAGGIILTEYSSSDEVFSDLFAPVMQGTMVGSCQDRIPTVFQYSPGDPFWADNPFNPLPLNESGCGRDVSAFPGITPLAGWNNSQVSIAYRDLGAGRLWITDFDWQDTDTPAVDPSYADTNALMGYMITHGQ